MRAFLSVIIMLTISPVLAVATLVNWAPERWGGETDLLSIIGMSIFGILTVPLWFTYIPTLIAVPLVMNKLANKDKFKNLPLYSAIPKSLLVGACLGVLIFGLIILMALLKESYEIAINWTVAGGVSGGTSCMLIFLIYRLTGKNA